MKTNRKGLGGGSLCSHLVAVSLTRTWFRREEQLNSNPRRKVTWEQRTRGHGRFLFMGQLQRSRSPCVPPSLNSQTHRFQPLLSQSPFLMLGPNSPWLQSERQGAPHCKTGHERKGLHIPPSLDCPSGSRRMEVGIWGWGCTCSPAHSLSSLSLSLEHLAVTTNTPVFFLLPQLLLNSLPKGTCGMKLARWRFLEKLRCRLVL